MSFRFSVDPFRAVTTGARTLSPRTTESLLTPRPPRPPSDARARIAALSRQLSQPTETNPFETVGFRGRMGSLLDGLREDRDDAAGRAGALGLSPGAAMAAGAGARSRALASGLRLAAGDAEAQMSAERSRRMGALLQVLGLEANLDEADKDRAERKRAALLKMLGTLGKEAVNLIPGVREARAATDAGTSS